MGKSSTHGKNVEQYFSSMGNIPTREKELLEVHRSYLRCAWACEEHGSTRKQKTNGHEWNLTKISNTVHAKVFFCDSRLRRLQHVH